MEFDYHKAVQEGNVFEKNVFVEYGAVIGKNNIFSNNCVIRSCCVIGDNNFFSTNVTIGSLSRERFQGPSKPKNITESPKVIIGNNNIFEDNVVIQLSLEKTTKIGNNVCIGAFTHVSHDTEIKDYVITASHCSIGGYCVLLEHANLGMGSRIHQRTVIGSLVMIGAGSVVVNHILPYSTVVGVPAHFLQTNKVGLKRAGLTNDEIEVIEKWLTSKSTILLPEKLYYPIRAFKCAVKLWRRRRGIVPNIEINVY